MRLRRQESEHQAVFSPVEHASSAERLRKIRNAGVAGSIALVGITAGIDASNAVQTTDTFEAFLAYSPGVIGGGLLMCVPFLNMSIREDREKSKIPPIRHY